MLVSSAVMWLVRNSEQVVRIFSFSPLCFLSLIPMVVLSQLVIGLMNQLLATHLGAPLRFRQWVSLAFASTLANYILPMRAGAALRAGYLKHQCNLPFTRFASAMAAVYIITLLSNAGVGIAVMLWFYARKSVFSPMLFGVFLGLAFVCAALLFFPKKACKIRSERRIWTIVEKIYVGWDMLRACPGLLLRIAGLALILTGLFVLRLHVAFAAVGNPANMAGCLLIATLTAVSMFISITPASLGTREAAILFSGMAAGISPEACLLAGGVDRIVAILVAFVLGTFGSIGLARETGKGLKFLLHKGR